MPIVRKTQDMHDMPIVSLSTGEILGKVSDILIDPNTRTVAAVVLAEGGLLNRATKLIPSAAVQIWGEDVVIVVGPDVFVEQSGLPCGEQCVSVARQIKGRDVVSKAGTRVGTLNDVLVNEAGAVVGFDLGHVAIQGPLAKSKRISMEATHAMGTDVLVVDDALLEV